MYLFHAVTNTHLINIVQAKTTLFKDEEADLFIVESMRISKNIVEQIEKRKIFRRVVSIPAFGLNPVVDVQNKPEIVRLAGHLLNAIHEVNRITKQIVEALADTQYSRVFIAHFGIDHELLLRCLINLGNNFRISLLEEGAGWLYLDMADDDWDVAKSIKARVVPLYIKHETHCPYTIREIYQKYIDDFYFYQPKYYSANEHLKTQKLIPITDKNSVAREIMRIELNDVDISMYNNRRIIYFESATESSSSYESQQRDIDTILSICPPDQVLIKHHPKAKVTIEDTRKKSSLCPSGVFVDTRSFFLESLFSEISLDNKILITSCSAAVLSPKYMFGKEPCVMFTHLISGSGCKVFTEKTINDLLDCYEDKSKILVPKTIDEMRTILSQYCD